MSREEFVDSLIGFTDRLLGVLWPAPAATSGAIVIALRTYIELILRRSRTSYSTLLTALYYLVLLRSMFLKQRPTVDQLKDVKEISTLECQRRMFLAALILSSKYTQDQSYSSRAWATISGLSSIEINANEALFLSTIDWRLYLPPITFERWVTEVSYYARTPEATLPGVFVCLEEEHFSARHQCAKVERQARVGISLLRDRGMLRI